MSRTSFERLMHIQFMSCDQEVVYHSAIAYHQQEVPNITGKAKKKNIFERKINI